MHFYGFVYYFIYLSCNFKIMDELVGALLFLLWMGFNIYTAFKKRNKEASKGAAAPKDKKQQQPQGESTFEEILREIRKASEQKKEPVPAKPVPATMSYGEEKRRSILAEKERMRAERYKQFVEDQRATEHDANIRQMGNNADNADTESYGGVDFDLDLRHIIIADAVLNRPYK